jgi:hypothetical protein
MPVSTPAHSGAPNAPIDLLMVLTALVKLGTNAFECPNARVSAHIHAYQRSGVRSEGGPQTASKSQIPREREI